MKEKRRARRAAGQGVADEMTSIAHRAKSGARSSPSRDFTKAWAGFLERFAWAHVAHLSFAVDRGRDGARASFRSWVRRLNMLVPGGVAVLCVVEQGRAGRRWHLHALVAGSERLEPVVMEQRWLAGRSQVMVYRHGGGMAEYLGRKLAAGTEWLLVGDLPQHGRRPAV